MNKSLLTQRKQTLFASAKRETVESLGAEPGSLGAVNVDNIPILLIMLQGRTNMTTGANEDDFHSGVDIARDIAVDEWMDLRKFKMENCAQIVERIL